MASFLFKPLSIEQVLLMINTCNINAEATAVQKPHQGTLPKSGCFRFRGPFFGSFVGKQKRTII
jgi:hypothetical protein